MQSIVFRVAAAATSTTLSLFLLQGAASLESLARPINTPTTAARIAPAPAAARLAGTEGGAVIQADEDDEICKRHRVVCAL
ncbi:MAG: hypothetical protein ACXWCV_10880 [Caldimonas sp.]